MQPDSENASHDLCGRLNVHDSSFRRPRTKSINFPAFAERDCQILVPNNLPVCASGLIEKNPSYCKASWPQDSLDDFTDGLRHCKPVNTRNGQKISRACSVEARP